MKSVTDFLQRLAQANGALTMNEGIATFEDGTVFDLGASFDLHWGPMLERFPLCNAGANPHNYTIEASKSGDYYPESGAAIYSEVRVNIFVGPSDNCVADVLVGLTDLGEPRVMVSAAGNVDDLPISVYPLRAVDAAVKSLACSPGEEIESVPDFTDVRETQSFPTCEEIPGGELPSYLTVESHCLDPETVEMFKREFGVVAWDRTDEPWSVVFQGPRERLVEMYKEHWGDERAPSEHWLSNIPPIYATINRAKYQIMVHVQERLVRADTNSFSELDDQMDANGYGDFFEDYLFDALMKHFGGRDENEGMPDGMMKYTQEVQNAIDVWLRDGGIKGSITSAAQRPS